MFSPRLLEKDKQYLWHPYTQMKDYEDESPILIERADGICLYDHTGKMYYDTISSWWCNVHGHNHPQVSLAIRNQLEKLDHVLFAGFTHENAILLAEQLVGISPKNLTKVFYSDNGSTACEVALKMSFQFWKQTGKGKKERFIGLENGYHGDTIGAMSVGGTATFQQVFSPMLFPAYKAPSPYCYRCQFGKEKTDCNIECIQPLEKLLSEKHDRIAGLILEPLVQAAGGMIIYPVEYLKRAAKLASAYEVHLIVDEVATGFGRTGKMLAVEYADISPDFICLSKGITNGTLPLAATLTTEEIYSAFYADYKENKTFYHGHTYTANPLATAAACASIKVFEEEMTLDHVQKLIPVFHQGMQRFADIPFVGDIRCLGMIGSLELVKDRKTRQPFAFEERIGFKVYKEGLGKGLILRPLGNVVYFFLPLCTKPQELEDILERTYALLHGLFDQ
ncbi:MAG: adenosylmethionine--8-amino-7-oxononanoate transaminase [Pseudomonadota bacterium]